MKLYLSSDGFLTKRQFKRLVGKEYKQAKVALIMHAADWHTPIARRISYIKTRMEFRKIGVKADVVDLKKFYNKSQQSLLAKLSQYDLIWARGGNTFLLRYTMKRSGFDAVIKELLSKGIVYGGSSAGALVMGPTLKYIEYADDPSFSPEIIWKGLGMIKTVPLPHWGNRWYAKAVKKAYLSLKKDKVDVVKLVDGEALLVEDGLIEKVKTNRYWRR